MQHLTSILLILSVAMTILMAGVLMTRAQKENIRVALTEGIFWDMGLFICFSIEILVFESLLT